MNQQPQIASIKPVGKTYTEIVEIRVPCRFYFVGQEYDGVEFGPFAPGLQPWEEMLLNRCLSALQREQDEPATD